MRVNKFLGTLAVIVLLASGAALSKSMPLSMIGVGPHGYDFAFGTWSCRNTVPTRVSGPTTGTSTNSRTAGGALFARVISGSYDVSFYTVYSPKTKTWLSPGAYSDGSYEFESARQTGAKVVWSGTFYDAASGQTHPVRDIYTYPNLMTSIDVTQVQTGGTWRTVGNTTCKKS